MNNNQADLFLDTYKRLETAAEGLVGSNGRSSSILRLSHLPAFSRYREELDYCRQVRNLLTHEAKIDGAYGVIPSQQLLAVLQKVLRQIEDPPIVGECMTPVSHLLTAAPTDGVLTYMTRMRERGVTYLPILTDGRVVGVFSQRSLFGWLLTHYSLNETMTFEGMTEHLTPHQGIRFVPREMPLEQAKLLFQRVSGKHQQIKLLLVTQHGQSDRPLLGIVSPYDVLKEE